MDLNDPLSLLSALYSNLGASSSDPSSVSAGATGSAMGGVTGGVDGELCDMAVGMGRPDLIYTFLVVVASHPLWQSPDCHLGRRCAEVIRQNVRALDRPESSSTSNSAEGAANSEDGAAEVGWEARLLPRLYRLRFDPNPHTRVVMGRLWSEIYPKVASSTLSSYGNSSSAASAAASSV